MVKVIVLSLLTLTSAIGAIIPVVNASFEDPGLPDGTGLTPRPTLCGLFNPPGYGCIGFGSGWVNPYFEGDSAGTMNPTTAMFPSVPDGEQIAYSNGGPFYQILPVTVTPGVTYTMRAYAGQRADVEGNLIGIFYENQGYNMELAVAGTGNFETLYTTRTTLARTTNNYHPIAFAYPSINAPDAPLPAKGQWLLIELSYTVPIGGPTGPLMIAFRSPAVQASFDMVSVFDSTADSSVPEPSTAILALAGFALLLGRRHFSAK
jgi:hypothetical protein